MQPDDLARYARDVAPHVDRLAIAVHKHGRPAGAALLREFGLSSAGILIDARAILLAGPISLDDLSVIARYTPRERLAAALDVYVQQGILDRDDSAETPLYACTTRGRDLLLRLTEQQGQTITALWAVHTELLPSLVLAATRVVDHAAARLPPERYRAFFGQHAAPAPLGASPAHLLLTRLTTLRYLRADAHALALAAAHLDPGEAQALTALWRADPASMAFDDPASTGDESAADARDALPRLRARDLVEQEGSRWRISAPGRALREEIEAATDRAAAPPFAAFDADDRAAFLRGLARLPD